MILTKIEILGLPEGFEVTTISINPKETVSQCFNTVQATIHLKKIQPRRIVLGETNEERRICYGEWYESQEGKLMRWPYGGKTDGKHRVWREVKETDTPLNNSEPKLSLSVDECRNVRSLIKDFENLGWFVNPARSLLLQKITEFIKDK